MTIEPVISGFTRDGRKLTIWYERDDDLFRAEAERGETVEHTQILPEALLDDDPIEVVSASFRDAGDRGRAVAAETKEHGVLTAVEGDDDALHDEVLARFLERHETN